MSGFAKFYMNFLNCFQYILVPITIYIYHILYQIFEKTFSAQLVLKNSQIITAKSSVFLYYIYIIAYMQVSLTHSYRQPG